MTLGRPVICLVTDRRRLGAPSEAASRAALVDLVRAAGAAEIDLVQLRERDLAARDLAELAERCLAGLAGTKTRLVINDRLDVALAVGAHGVHLRGDSMSARRVRDLAPPAFLVGRSVHSPAEARGVASEGGVDYLIVGTVFESASKPEAPVLGIAEFARAVREAANVPVLAIGGITLRTVREVAAAGAAGVAAVGLFVETAGPRLAHLPETVAGLRAAFDTSRSVV